MNNDLVSRLLKALGPMSYRERLDRRSPEMFEQIRKSATEMMELAQSSASDAEVNDFIANNEMIVIDGIFGMLNACEILSEGKLVSRSRGSSPINAVAAFVYWLWQNPEVSQKFRESDIFQELLASSDPAFEWPDNFDDDNTLLEIFKDETPAPGNYL